MIDVRPVGYVIGMLVAALGITMLLPMLADLLEGRDQGGTFAVSALVTVLTGGAIALACKSGRAPGLTLQQIFLLTTGTWVFLPLFGAIPFWIGAPDASFTDAFFEAMSGFTTTGATVFVGLQDLPAGTLLWRGLMQWFGGVGMVVVALSFLPALRVGGMQIFRSEAFDTGGKILPRAGEIAVSISVIYLGITVVCMLAYSWTGMNLLDSMVHAMTTVATGGMANDDASFGAYRGAAEYVAAIFMLIASLPFVLYVFVLRGTVRPLLRDPQVHGFLTLLAFVVVVLTAWQIFKHEAPLEPAFREAFFNVASIISGTGYSSVDYQLWGGFAAAIFFLIGLVGGCAGSTCCSVKIFRYQLLFAAIRVQIRRLQSPRGLFALRYDGKPVTDDVINSVMAFFVVFYLSLAVLSVLLSLMGLDPVTAISGAATTLANIGPGLGDIIGPAGNFSSLTPEVKWVMAIAMLIGRLELMSVFVLFTFAFWRK